MLHCCCWTAVATLTVLFLQAFSVPCIPHNLHAPTLSSLPHHPCLAPGRWRCMRT